MIKLDYSKMKIHYNNNKLLIIEIKLQSQRKKILNYREHKDNKCYKKLSLNYKLVLNIIKNQNNLTVIRKTKKSSINYRLIYQKCKNKMLFQRLKMKTLRPKYKICLKIYKNYKMKKQN